MNVSIELVYLFSIFRTSSYIPRPLSSPNLSSHLPLAVIWEICLSSLRISVLLASPIQTMACQSRSRDHDVVSSRSCFHHTDLLFSQTIIVIYFFWSLKGLGDFALTYVQSPKIIGLFEQEFILTVSRFLLTGLFSFCLEHDRSAVSAIC